MLCRVSDADSKDGQVMIGTWVCAEFRRRIVAAKGKRALSQFARDALQDEMEAA
jgi:hypothetical protein